MTSCFAPASGSAYRGVASAEWGGGGGVSSPQNPTPILKGVPSLFSAGMLINQISYQGVFVSSCIGQNMVHIDNISSPSSCDLILYTFM